VGNVRLKKRFESAVETTDLVVRLGTWKETPTRTRPAWETLSKAKVWTQDRFGALKLLLKSPREPPELTTAHGAAVRGVVVSDDKAGHGGCKVDAYKTADGVPPALLDRRVRLAVVDVQTNTRPVRPSAEGCKKYSGLEVCPPWDVRFTTLGALAPSNCYRIPVSDSHTVTVARVRSEWMNPRPRIFLS